MGLNIGLDFGTTNSTISFFKGGEPIGFSYGQAGGKESIPSFIAYHPDGTIDIGDAARTSRTSNTDADCYGNFKMDLPDDSKFNNGRQRNPKIVTSDYLRQLLIESDECFVKQKGKIDNLVISVPEMWLNSPDNQGRERLHQVITNLGFSADKIRLISEPVAAASYYVWKMQQDHQPFEGNLLVCDMGGGTFDVCLCSVVRGIINVEYFQGFGNHGLTSAGVAFDRSAVQKAYHRKHGRTINEDANPSQFHRLLMSFETTKISHKKKANQQLNNYLKDPDLSNEIMGAYKFQDGVEEYELTFEDVAQAFEPISQGIDKVMKQFKDYQFDRIFLCGGFSQFPLVKKAIIKALEIDSEEDPRFDQQLGIADGTYAIAYGACLIADKKIDPTEKYPYSMGVFSHKPGEKETPVTLIEAGTPVDQLLTPQFYEKILSFHLGTQIDIWLKTKTETELRQTNVTDLVKISSNYHVVLVKVGMKLDRSQFCYLVIQEYDDHQQPNNVIGTKTFPLGNIIAKMFQGFVPIE